MESCRILIMMTPYEKTEEDKLQEFILFKYANSCGLILGIVGAAFINILVLSIKTNFNLASKTPEGSAMLIIIMFGSILYLVIINLTKKTIGVNDSLDDIFTYE